MIKDTAKSRVIANVMGHTTPDNLKNQFVCMKLLKLECGLGSRTLGRAIGAVVGDGVVQTNSDDFLHELIVRDPGILG